MAPVIVRIDTPEAALDYCGKPIASRARFEAPRRCLRLRGHAGKCSVFPFLAHLQEVAPKVAQKIRRDATQTTGAAWQSDDAGPNRIDRWAMLLPADELRRIAGLDIDALSEGVQRKLREKAASYSDCMEVAQALTWMAYGMEDAPEPPGDIAAYLETLFGPIRPGTTTCIICKAGLSFDLFREARRGKALIETAHKNPRSHTPDNVGFAHRFCNIAQGERTIDEFYDWMESVLRRVGRLP